MRKKEQMFWLASRSRMWRIPLCMAAFSLLPSAYSFASAENPATETVLAVNSVQQQRTVKGIVIDANGEAVIGANVKEPGSTTGTITDMNGEFSLSVGPKATLEISFIGYTTQKVNVGASNTVKVILKEDTKVLDEVVITGFGMSQKKATLTGAVAAIASTDIERSNATTASGALVGKIAGINTRQNDGRPGASTQLQIRNMGAPLYVIDGVVSDDGQFNNMDFNDIESISILKDASAAIYGVRAANGVVVVTSKKGQRNSKNSVSINAYYGWQHNSRYVQPAKTKDYVNAYVSAETWAKKADNDRRYNKEEYAKWMAGTEKNYQGFDWSDYIWITAPQSYISANLSGGTDKANYYVAVSHIDQEATVRGYGGFRRTNAQMNIDMNISDRFKIGATMNGRIEDRHHPGVPGADDTWLPRFATMKNQPTKRPYANDNPLYPQLVSDQKETNFALLNYDTSGKVSDVWRVLQMQTTAEYEILKGLKAKGMLGYYYAYNELDNQEYTFKLYGYNEKTGEYYETAAMDNPYRERNREKVEDQFANFQLNFDRRFGNHSINAVASFEATQRKRPKSWVHSVPVANGMDLIRFKEIVEYNDTGNNTEARMGWLGRINYSFADRYLIELIGRWDGSWKFKPENRWGFFPAVSLGWRVSEEAFFKEALPMVDNFKIRGSFGKVGDEGVTGYSDDDEKNGKYRAYQYLMGYRYPSGNYVLGTGGLTNGAKDRGMPNLALTWYESKTTNVGFEASVLSGLINVEFDYFVRKRSGLLTKRQLTLPTTFGQELPVENLNSDRNQGFEIVLGHRHKIGDFTYDVKGNFSTTRIYNEHVERAASANMYDDWRNNNNDRYKDIQWGKVCIGQFQSYEEILNSPIQDNNGNKSLMPGDLKFQDWNNDGIIDGKDDQPIGHGNTPRLYYGLNLYGEYKGFDLTLFFQGAAGHEVFTTGDFMAPFIQQGLGNGITLNLDHWHREDPSDMSSEWIPGYMPALRPTGFSANSGTNTWTRQKANYLRLKTIELGYTFPKKWMQRAGIENLRIYVNSFNTATITSREGIMKYMDPENKDGMFRYYPQMKTFNFGVNLTF